MKKGIWEDGVQVNSGQFDGIPNRQHYHKLYNMPKNKDLVILRSLSP